MAYAPDDRPRDSLGRPTRRLRYPVLLQAKFSKDARQTLEEMAAASGMKVGKLIRRAVMKDIYIYKAKQAKKETQS